MSRNGRPICPKCGEHAARSQTRYGIRHDCCGLWSWGNHPLADKATHDARRAAHAAFDPIWQQRLLPRAEAYGRLATMLGIPTTECHMKKMDAPTAARVPDIARQIRCETG